jgi:pyruvate/2-oxoglutarate dehydrogenase complex dihydrolipoamide acyltransferase (E2) component
MIAEENGSENKAPTGPDLEETQSAKPRSDELELRMHGEFQQERLRDDSVLLKGFLIVCGLALVVVLAVGISRWISQSGMPSFDADTASEPNAAADEETSESVADAAAAAMQAPAAEAPAADAAAAAAADVVDEAAMAAAEDAGIAAADAQFAAEAERERLLAEAEVARARKEALQAERELLAEQRRQAEQSAQMAAAAAPKLSCPYNVANPLKCASRDRQPTACAWNFEACGMPRLFKQESKTTCTGKMSADQAAGRIIIVDGCRGLFVPEF